MTAYAKSAPLVTFLASVRPSTVYPVSETPAESPESEAEAVERPAHDKDIGQGARAVILTILSKNADPVPEARLRSQSEINEDLYHQTLRELEQKHLVETTDRGWTLTTAGINAAAQERERILSFW